MRLFVSVDLDGLADRVEAVQSLLEDASGLRLTDPTQAHLTLKFLGETPESELSELTAALERAVEESAVAPFEAAFGGLGVFPHLDYISVVWLGVREGCEELTQLHEHVERETTRLGFDPEEHDFTPHVTVGRMEHAGGKSLVQDVVSNRDPDVGTITVEEIRLKESTLTSDGPVYSTLERFEL